MKSTYISSLLLLAVCWLVLPIQSVAQTGPTTLKREVRLSVSEASISDHIEALESEHKIILSFNSRGIDLERVVSVSSPIIVSDLLLQLFEGYQFTVINRQDEKLILIFSNVQYEEEFMVIRGKVTDSNTGEVLSYSTIHDELSNSLAYTNEYGFYSLEIPIDTHRVVIHSLGYRDKILSEIKSSEQSVQLDFDNELSTIMISQKINEDYVRGSGAEKISLNDPFLQTGVSGESDILELTKSLPGIQSGNEGQTGIYVRGGSPDQNLILLDGIPMYETSHAVGLSSIFMTESVRDVSIIKNGFPARYGGRLSSVLNISLKDGNKSAFHGSADLGLMSGSLHLEGPLFSENTSFSIAGRKSLIGLYLNDTYTQFTEYDNIDLDYYDVTAKISHNFSPVRKFSLSYYKGKDDFGLERSEEFTQEGDLFSAGINNKVEWGSQIVNAQFSNVISDNFFFNFSLGGNRYSFDSRSTYDFLTRFNNINRESEYDISSTTEIIDYIGSINMDYYANDHHRIKFGASYTRHSYRPAIRKSRFTVNEVPDSNLVQDILVAADEYGIYLEDTYTINSQWEMYFGMHLSGFNVGTALYNNYQPRFKLIYQPSEQDRFDFAYANTAQYIHLLINPGTGLPSDLWVPSTEEIKPETAKQVSLNYSRVFSSNLKVGIGGYIKQMNNVLEYQSPVEFIFDVINQQPTIDSSSWDERVVPGEALSRGLELSSEYNVGQWRTWLSYTYSKTTRTFPSLNDGEPFPYKYDRRHDMSLGVNYQVNDNLSFTTNWTYGEGNAFSLSVEVFQEPGGSKLINGGERNNYQLPSFHHLDLLVTYNKKIGNNDLVINAGIYNLYSRLNGFYIYIFENPLSDERVARKVSILPILPQLNLSYSF